MDQVGRGWEGKKGGGPQKLPPSEKSRGTCGTMVILRGEPTHRLVCAEPPGGRGGVKKHSETSFIRKQSLSRPGCGTKTKAIGRNIQDGGGKRVKGNHKRSGTGVDR